MRNRKYLPVLLDITDKKIVVIGAGKTAYSKVKILMRFTDNISILAEHVCDEIHQTGLPVTIKTYEKNDLDGCHLLYSCTNNRDLNKVILKDGQEKGVLVNIHDDPELCEFVSPAVYKKNNISVAVGSDAKDVMKSIELRDKIKEFIESNQLL